MLLSSRTIEVDQNPYEQLGVRPFIHCAGVRTIHGGSLMLSEVSKAMELAARQFVNIDELMEAVSRRLASLTGAQAGIVTSGCAAALCHATAAAITGADPEKMLRLPHADGLQTKVIMLTSGRFTYDHAIRMVGARIVEVESRQQFAHELEDGAALIALLGVAEENGKLRLSEIAPMARAKGIPILVDAAAEVPQCPNPFLSRGASMVAYSGGKYLRGPQCAGLLLGEERWIRAAWMHSAPHHTFGRPMKVGKEEIVGMLTAVEIWARQRKLENEKKVWDADLDTVASRVTTLPSVTTKRLPAANSTDVIPKMEVSWDFAQLPIRAMEIRTRLLNGTPRIMLDDRGSSDTSLLILPFSIQPGEAAIVGEAIRGVMSEALSRARQKADAPNPTPSGPDLDGSWELDLSFTVGSARHRLDLAVNGSAVSGTHSTLYFQNPIAGFASNGTIEISSLHKFEGTNLAYRFIGSIDGSGSEMSGTAELGSTGQAAPGPLNMKEYGNASWKARRISNRPTAR